MFAERRKKRKKEISETTRKESAIQFSRRVSAQPNDLKLTRSSRSPLTPRMTHPQSLRRIHMRHKARLSSRSSLPSSSEHLVPPRSGRVERVRSSCASRLLLLLSVRSRLTWSWRAEGRAVRWLAEMGLRRTKEQERE